MRNEVKVGLAVGAVLFAGVLVYILFVAGRGQKPGADLAMQDPGAGSAVVELPPAQPAPLAPQAEETLSTMTPAPATLPAAPSVEMTMLPPATAPAVVETPRTDWGAWLDGRSSQPAPRSSADDTASAAGSFDRNAATAGGSVPTIVAGTGPRKYTVKSGDTYWSISKSIYGSPDYISHVMRANPTVPASKLRAGMVITLPDPAEVLPVMEAEIAGSAGGAGSAEASGAGSVTAGRTYRVQPGDTLYGISMKLYGSSEYVTALYEMNKSIIGSNPNRVRAGMELQVPAAPSR